jgi:hypothetical protein
MTAVLDAGVLDVYRDPEAEGYRHLRQASRGEEVAPEAFSDVVLGVDNILG